MPLHFRTSKSRRLFVVAALFVVGCFVVILWPTSQPSYEGRKLADWLKDFPLGMDPAGNEWPLSPEQQKSVERAGDAIRMMGESALLVLDAELRATDNRLDWELFRVFNRWHKYLRYEYHYTPAYVRQCRAISAVAELGTESSRFVPVLTRIYSEGSKDDVVRFHARLALQKMAPDVISTNK